MKKFNIIIGILFSILFLYLAFRNVDLNKTIKIIKNLNLKYFLYAIFFTIILILLRAERWRIILYPSNYGFYDTFAVFMMGVAALYVFPVRLGEFARPVLMKKRGESSSYVLATVVFERLLDGMSQILLFIISIFLIDFKPWIKKGGYLVAALYISVLIMLILLKVNRKLYNKIIKKIFFFSHKYSKLIIEASNNFISGLTIMDDKKRLVQTILLSIVSWSFAILFVSALLTSIGLNFHNVILVSIFLQFMVTLGMVIPAAPGYIGTFHYFCVEGLTFFNISSDKALAFAILFHGFNLFAALIPGTFFFIREILFQKSVCKT